MSKKYNSSMFDKIKDALKKTEKTPSGSFTNIMKFPAGHTYTLRLIPNIDDVDATFFHHYLNQWSSKKDGSFISAISLKTFNERDPINEMRWRIYKDWKATEPGKDEKLENPIREKEAWLVNVYVVEDPANPENNGKIKILNMGPQLKAIVDDAMDGDSSDEFGASIFDLSSGGADFKIKAEEQGVYTTYIKSRFSNKTVLDLSDEEIDNVYENVYDLKQVHAVKTVEELQELLDEHFEYCESSKIKTEERKPLNKRNDKSDESKGVATPIVDEDPNDDIPMFHGGDNDMDDLLKELDL